MKFTSDPIAAASAKKQRVFRTRAAALALARAPDPPGMDTLEVVEFALGQEVYAISSAHVRWVHPLKDYTPLPGTPSFVLGLFQVRGQVVSIIDLRRILDLPEQGLTGANCVLVLHSGEMEFGLLADAVRGVRAVSRRELLPGLPTMTDIRGGYVVGVTADRVTVLDAENLLADRRLVVQAEN